MSVPAQLEIVEATFDVIEDRSIAPQEVCSYCVTVTSLVVMMALGSIFWSMCMESYEESVEAIL
jgi:hypothetical protein